MEEKIVEIEERFSLEKKIIILRLEDMITDKIIESFELKKWHGDPSQKVMHIDIFFKYQDSLLETGSLINFDYKNKNLLINRLDLYNSNPKAKEFKNFILDSINKKIKGQQNEERLFKIASSMKKEHFSIDGFSYTICSVLKTSPFYDNKVKADIFIRINVLFGNLFFQRHLFDIPIQCKSSVSGQKKHKEKHQDIPSIVVSENFYDMEIRNKIIQLTGGWLLYKASLIIEKVFLLEKENAQKRAFEKNNKKLMVFVLEKIHQ